MYVDLALGILDHQIVDCDGVNCGKVDDLEIAALGGGAPEVTAILVGGGAWASRGLLGRVAARISGGEVRIPWAQVASVTSVVTLRTTARDAGLGAGDRRWASLVGRIPGS